jgi:hypothetical protein
MLLLRSLLVCALVLFARTATAIWTEEGDVDIAISTPGTVLVEADEVEPGDVMAYVYVGGPSTTGEVTVVGEGDVTTRKQLGDWDINQGSGDIQTVIGAFSARVTIGDSAAPTSTAGVLTILNSDLEDISSFAVYQGTLNVIASRIGSVEVYEDGALYTSLGSRLGNLTTQADSYTSVVESIVSSTQRCSLRSTVIVEDSAFRCRHIEIATSGESEADVDVRAVGVPSVTLEATDLFEVQSGDVDISSAVVTTGALEVGAFATNLGIAASLWTNEGGTTVCCGSGSPARLAIGAGSRFHELGSVRVAGAPAFQHLTVNGAGTELEVEGDLRIGQTEDHLGQPYDFTGNTTVSNGAEVIVHGTLAVRPQGVLTIESGATVYAAAVENLGTITENGGTLVVPEANGALAGIAALSACAWRARSRRS